MNKPITKMCKGCARNEGARCATIKSPAYMLETRGYCFAKVDKKRAVKIEKEIKDKDNLNDGGWQRVVGRKDRALYRG